MKIETLKELQQSFGEKTFMGDGYYRIRALENDQLELAFLEAGPCGDTTAHPQITVQLDKNKHMLIPVKLLDLAVSPTRRWTAPEHQAELEQALIELEKKFLQALKEKQ